MMNRILALGAMLALGSIDGFAIERNLGVVGLTQTDTARVSVTHDDVEPLWIDVRFYDMEGELIRTTRLIVRPKQIRFVDLSGGEARVRTAGSRVQVRAVFEVIGSPDGTIVGDSDHALAALEVLDNITEKSIAVVVSASAADSSPRRSKD